jgi:hypothetical protein
LSIAPTTSRPCTYAIHRGSHTYERSGKEQQSTGSITYGRGIPRSLGINLLVQNVDRSAKFQAEVFGAKILYWEEHFAIMRAVDSTWLLHSDWSYRNHEFIGVVAGVEARGCGVELRLYGVDPDQAEAAARRRDAVVLAAAADKEHGLR